MIPIHPSQTGGAVHLELLRPIDWILRNRIAVGRTLRFRGAEAGLNGVARIEVIKACPPIAAGNGSVVTGRIASGSDTEVVDLRLTNGTIVRGTPQHAVWSESRKTWIAIADLAAGEQVRVRPTDANPSGLTTVAVIDPVPGRHAVYNIEVHGEHVYEVGPTGLLVHNNGLDCQELLELMSLKSQQANGALSAAEQTRLDQLQTRFVSHGADAHEVAKLHQHSLPADQRAIELHEVLDDRAQRHRTTAVTETNEGIRIVSSSNQS